MTDPTVLLASLLALVTALALVFWIKRHPTTVPWLLFLSAGLYWFLELIPMPTFGGSGVVYSDFIVLFLTAALIWHLGGRLWPVSRWPKALVLLWLLTIPPLFVGWAHGYNILTVLRDSRSIPYYFLPIPLCLSLREHPEQIPRLMRGMLYFTMAAVVAYFLLRLFNIRLYSRAITYDFQGAQIYTWWGFHSWVYLYMFGTFYLLPRLILGVEARRYEYLFVWITFTVVLLGLLIRGLFIGWVVGSCFLLLMLLRRLKRRAFGLFLGVLLVAATILIVNTPVSALRSIPVVARYGSMISSSLNYQQARATAATREKGLLLFTRNEGFYFWAGEGYGDPPLAYSERRDSVRSQMMVHSAWGFLLSRHGLVGTALFLGLLLYLFVRPFPDDGFTEATLDDLTLRAFLLGMLMVGAGSNVFFFEKFSEMEILLTLALLEANAVAGGRAGRAAA